MNLTLFNSDDFGDGLNPLQNAPQYIDNLESPPPSLTEEEIVGLLKSCHNDLGTDLAREAASTWEVDEEEIIALLNAPHSDLIAALPAFSQALPPPSLVRKASPKLTNADKGLHKQFANYNLGEMAEALRKHLTLLNINDVLAFYQPPCWTMLTKKQAIKLLRNALDTLFPKDAAYLSRAQLEDILGLLLCDSNIKSLSSTPKPNQQLICFRDRLYDWKTGQLHQHMSDDLRFSSINMDATQLHDEQGEQFEDFMDWITGGDSDLRLRILEMIGVIISGAPVKCFFYLKGPSGTGKSQLSRFLRVLLGESSCYSIPDINTLSDRWTTGNIAGKLLCVCADIPDKPLKPAAISVIKQITGDDPIEGERKHQPSFIYECTAKLLFVGNYELKIPEPEREEALLQRLVQITLPCAVSKEVQIPQFYKLLLDEAGYIVSQALDALVELEKRHFVFSGVPGNDLIQPKYSTVERFVEACCVLAPQARSTTHDLYNAYCEWCGERSVNYTLAQFGLRLSQTVPELKPTRSSQSRGFMGIALKDF